MKNIALRSAGLAAAAYFLLGALRYAFFSTSADLTIFFQALAAPPHAPWFQVWIKGADRNIFGDHFHPAILVLWPVVQLLPSPLTLLAAQALITAGGLGILVREYARRRPREAHWFAIACYANPGVVGAIAYDVHEVALGVPLLAWWVVAVRRGRPWLSVVPALGLLLVKEDMALIVLGLGLVLTLRRWFAAGTTLMVTALVWAQVVSRWIIPRFAHGGYTYAATLPDVLDGLRHLAAALLVPGLQTLTLLMVLGCFVWARIRWSLLVALVPYLLLLGAVGNFRYQTFLDHYYLLPAVLVAGAVLIAADDLPRPGTTRRRVGVGVLCLALLAGPGTVALARTDWSSRPEAVEAVRAVPAGARVAAPPEFTARLAVHHPVSLLRPGPFVDAGGQPLDDVVWVVLDLQTRSFGGPAWVPDTLATLRAQGFREHSRFGRYVVLTRA